MKLKKWLMICLLPLLFVLGAGYALADEGALLKNAITEIKIWDHTNGREATKANGAYTLTQGGNYRYELTFDLSAYDGKLKDGDRFVFTVPNGATIANGTAFTLTDSETKVELGAAKMTSNGSGKGGIITVTIQNLEDYKSKTTASGVKGSFFFDFQATTVGANQDWTYNSDETNGTITHKVTINERRQSSFSTAGENYAKVGGVIAKNLITLLFWARAVTIRIIGRCGSTLSKRPITPRLSSRTQSQTAVRRCSLYRSSWS
ncbi:Alcohol dehydrogenase [Streptococcus sp. DD11]|nr:Alcohol dehydrogenase [Streptococcus sp. DD11]